MAILFAMPDRLCQAEGQQQTLQLWRGLGQAKKAMVRSHYAANVLEWRFLVAYVCLKNLEGKTDYAI